jgi:hypothetical protein
MAKSKKTKQPKVEEVASIKLEPIGTIGINQKKLEQCEWCFQFDEDEPQIFAWTNEGDTNEEPMVTFTITNSENSYINFNKDGKHFKLFVRELSDVGKQLRKKSLKQNEQNESTNKEA